MESEEGEVSHDVLCLMCEGVCVCVCFGLSCSAVLNVFSVCLFFIFLVLLSRLFIITMIANVFSYYS